VSRYGLVAYSSSLDAIGPLAKSVVDVATVLQTIACADDKDATAASAPVRSLAPLARQTRLTSTMLRCRCRMHRSAPPGRLVACEMAIVADTAVVAAHVLRRRGACEG
jgi:Asp-tRNA(Asn)/Glu-tRNA(Gln) amidotransferase A subunit family amidase